MQADERDLKAIVRHSFNVGYYTGVLLMVLLFLLYALLERSALDRLRSHRSYPAEGRRDRDQTSADRREMFADEQPDTRDR